MGAHVEIGICETVKLFQPAACQLIGLDAHQYGLGFEEPVESAVAPGLPELGFGHGLWEPAEVLGYIIEGGSRAEEVTVEILAAPHHHPGVVEEGVILVAFEPFLVFRIIAAARFAARALLDAVELYGFLRFFDRACERA